MVESFPLRVREDELQTVKLFYKPEDAWLGDVIPFFWEGVYHIYYLHDPRNADSPVPDTDWAHLTTQDFVTYENHGIALPRGEMGQRDLAVYTGSIIEKDGLFHLYYTGHNHHRHSSGEVSQVILRATSTDLHSWTKDFDFVLLPDLEHYEMDDWRDPFVFWNAAAEQYWMLFVARHKTGATNRRGCIARAVSEDLCEWRLAEPIWSPNQYFNLECPDLLRIGDWWYLIYSTFNNGYGTRYRRSRSIEGPWSTADHDFLDGRGFYAAKTISGGDRHFLLGWLATRECETDGGRWEWGGNLLAHELVQDTAGNLQARLPGEIKSALTSQTAAERDVMPEVTLESADQFTWRNMSNLPCAAFIEINIDITPGTQDCGLLLRADADLEAYYQLRIEPRRRRIVFDRWPKESDGPFWPRDNDPSFVIERPLNLTFGEEFTLQVLLDGDCLLVYAGELVALSTRIYDIKGDSWGVFVSGGAATFRLVTFEKIADRS